MAVEPHYKGNVLAKDFNAKAVLMMNYIYK